MILDTNAVSALFANDPALVRTLSTTTTHHLPVVVIGEYLFGLRGSDQLAKLGPKLAELEASSSVLPISRATAEFYGAIRDELRRKGRPIPDNDIWIAALAREHGLEIVSRDSHFDAVDGVQRLSW